MNPEGIVLAARCQAGDRPPWRRCSYVAYVVIQDADGRQWFACKNPDHQLGAVLTVPYIDWYHAQGHP